MTEATCWEIGNVKVTCVVETTGGIPPGMMFAGLTEDRVQAVKWLHPHWAGADGTVFYSVQAYILESQGRRIIVDTCIGNDKQRNNPGWNQLQLPFLEQLTKAGYPPETIDYVLCTHLHVDHVGWNTRWDGKNWVPTFPNARYLFGRSEWEHLSHKDHGVGDMPEFAAELGQMDQVMADSLAPIAEAGLHQLVESTHRLTDEVSLFPTPGHTPGHVSVAIRSGGKEAVITGDLAHNPIQFADPEICANFDFDRKTAMITRKKFIKDHADRDIVVFGTHFNSPSAGHIVRDKENWRFVPIK